MRPGGFTVGVVDLNEDDGFAKGGHVGPGSIACEEFIWCSRSQLNTAGGIFLCLLIVRLASGKVLSRWNAGSGRGLSPQATMCFRLSLPKN